MQTYKYVNFTKDPLEFYSIMVTTWLNGWDRSKMICHFIAVSDVSLKTLTIPKRPSDLFPAEYGCTWALYASRNHLA